MQVLPTDDLSKELQTLAAALPVAQPRAKLAWTAAVDVAPREALGISPLGER